MVLSVVKTFALQTDVRWNNTQYLAEMDRRFAELENRKVKGLTLDEVELEARASYKQKQVKNK